MKTLKPNTITAKEVHGALTASGFMPLVDIRTSMTWVRDNRIVVIRYDASPTETRLSDLNVTGYDYVTFSQLESGEIIALAH